MQLLVWGFLHFGGVYGAHSWSKYTYEESTFTSHTRGSTSDGRNAQQGSREDFGSVVRKNHYSVLGISKSAKDEEIRKAYTKLALEYHPDRHSTKSEKEREMMSSKFREVKEAYDTLSDPEKRRNYDKRNSKKLSPPETNLDDLLKEEATRPRFRGNIFEFSTSDFMNSGFDAEVFASFRKSFAGSFPNKEEKRTVNVEVSATLDEIFNGAHVSYKIFRKVPGSTEEKAMDFHIKPGYKAETSITLHEYGNQLSDGTFQDVRLVLVEKPHPVFTRVGNDLEMNVHIDFKELIGGFTRTIELPGNRTYTLTHREFEMIGEYITVPSLGMPLQRDPSKRGDLRIKCKMAVPQLTNAQRMCILMNMASLDDEE